jgi:hypothetical protein
MECNFPILLAGRGGGGSYLLVLLEVPHEAEDAPALVTLVRALVRVDAHVLPQVLHLTTDPPLSTRNIRTY